MRRLALAVVLSGCTLAGCTLIDQNTFRPGAGAAPVIPPAAPVLTQGPLPGPAPLLIIAPQEVATSDPALRQAIAAARARKPDVAFDVIAILPGAPPPDDLAHASIHDAEDVARRLVTLGVPQSRVRLVARPEAAALSRDVRVFVR